MAKYCKKPVVIEATQWFKMGDHNMVSLAKDCQYRGLADHRPGQIYGFVKTLEGGHLVTPGDWIIQGVKNEFYPCKPDIFEMTYESADDGNR